MKSNADKYPIIVDKILTNPHEGLIIGNGDFAANVTFSSHEIILSLGKNDIWDSRIDNNAKNQTLTQDDLIRYEKDYGFEWPENCDNALTRFANWEGKPEGVDVVFGSLAEEKERCGKLVLWFGGFGLRRAGRIRIRHCGFSNTKIHARLNVINGLLESTVDLGRSKVHFSTFVHKELNTLAMKLSVEGDTTAIQIFVEKEPDYADPTMPLPKVSLLTDHSGTISQLMPGKYDTPDFNWCIASSFPESTDKDSDSKIPVLDMAYALAQSLRLNNGNEITLFTGISTDRENYPDTRERAVRMMGENTIERFNRLFADSEQLWEKYWESSSIEIEDKELESVWYRNLYGFACHLKPGAQAPSLCANVPIDDNADFHSRYTWNHNVQKWFAAALPVNHLEWYDVFADLIRQHMPTFEYFSEMIFGLKGGVFCDLSSIPYAPPHRAIVNNKWGRALSHTGWLSLMLWQHWEYTHDAKWLEENAYDFIKKAAIFYSEYLKKYQKEDGDIYPSMRLEEPGWCKGFVGNKNQVTDIVMFKKAFECAISASETLGVDEEEREDWIQALKKVPDIDYGWTDDHQGWYAFCKDWDKFDSVIQGKRLSEFADMDWRLEYARTNRWGCGGWLVYPGEYLNGDEEGGLAEVMRDMLSRTSILRPKGTSTPAPLHSISAMIPFIRLGIIEKFDEIRTALLNHRFDNGLYSAVSYAEGQLPVWVSNNWRMVENQFQGIMCITEMLLQSQGNKICLFPYWPANNTAKFERLRARGGFFVSAEKDKDSLTALQVESKAGGKCCIKWPEKKEPVIEENGTRVPFDLQEQELVFNTEAGKTYNFKF